jgi:hypothetical protein
MDTSCQSALVRLDHLRHHDRAFGVETPLLLGNGADGIRQRAIDLFIDAMQIPVDELLLEGVSKASPSSGSERNRTQQGKKKHASNRHLAFDDRRVRAVRTENLNREL